MADDLFGGLGGIGDLIGGIAKNTTPKDSPEGKLLHAQSDLSDLKKQESELLVEIGRQAYAQNPSAWSQDSKLKLIQQNISEAESSLNEAKQAQQSAEANKAANDAGRTCTNCNTMNPEGVKFCQECGTPLGAAAVKHCGNCGAEMAPGVQFCGECGTRQ